MTLIVSAHFFRLSLSHAEAPILPCDSQFHPTGDVLVLGLEYPQKIHLDSPLLAALVDHQLVEAEY